MRNSYNLPTLGDLACFEAAARHLSFKKASSELNVTPAAVSQRIKSLEADLGQSLFVRRARGVDLSESGALLFVALQRGFDTIAEAVAQVRVRRDDGVTISATTAMGGFWLTPRLSAFWKQHADISVRQILQDAPQPGGGEDLTILYGDPATERHETRVLFHDRMLALGSPRFAARHNIRALPDLTRAPLIHVLADERWTDWNDWFAAMGAAAPTGPGFNLNSYMIALHAATDDVGAVLGWEGLTGDLIRSGALVQLVPEVFPAPWPFYMKIRPGSSAKARLFADWIVANG